MSQIHEVQVFEKKHYEIDPQRGAVLKSEQVLKRSGTTAIAFDGETYEIGEDGTFDVPVEVAAHFTARPGWYEGPNPFIEEYAAEADDDDADASADQEPTKTTRKTTRKRSTKA